MPLRNTPVHQIPYALIMYDTDARERTDDTNGIDGLLSKRILQHATTSVPSDIFMFSHGWQADIEDAIRQYDAWIDQMAERSADIASMGSNFHPLWIGVHWPSKPWGDEEMPHGSSTTFGLAPGTPEPATLLELYLERLGLQHSMEARQLLGLIFRRNREHPAAGHLPADVIAAYDRLNVLLGVVSGDPGSSSPGNDHVAFDAQAAAQAMTFGGPSFGISDIILNPLRVLSFWTMKDRARIVGENGMHPFVSDLQNALPKGRFHLMGHSFGTIVVSSTIAGQTGRSPVPVQSLVLVQGAVSLWSYADHIPSTGGTGFYNGALHTGMVTGPIVSTQSRFDLACRIWYPTAEKLAFANPCFLAPNQVVPQYPEYGAMGTWGIQGIAGNSIAMRDDSGTYSFNNGQVYNLNADEFICKSSGASGAHSDISGPKSGPAVSHMIWQAAR
ncbi:MAG: hypothetical protein ACYCOR_18285 [Acidobacteriaceae bacterium]